MNNELIKDNLRAGTHELQDSAARCPSVAMSHERHLNCRLIITCTFRIHHLVIAMAFAFAFAFAVEEGRQRRATKEKKEIGGRNGCC